MNGLRTAKRPSRLRDSPALQRLTRGAHALLAPGASARESELPRLLHERFQEAGGKLLSAERFDAEAAKLFLEATDPPVLADQSAVIRRLLQRRRSAASSPLVTSYEHQDPHFGRWVVSTLALGKYGEFKIVNKSDVRLNNPPTTLPPHEQRIHLCWGVGWAGAPAASALHGVVALLAEDWRVALARLPVRIDLHRLNPKPLSVSAERGRRRWRHADPPHPPFPPPSVVGAVFERANRAHALTPWRIHARSHDEQDGKRRANHWWCLCLLDSDLPRLGFSSGPHPLAATRSVWSAPRGTLPDAIEHVILVPPKPERGVSYSVRLTENRMVLEPLRYARTDIETTDYWNLRVAALDLVLDELSARMY